MCSEVGPRPPWYVYDAKGKLGIPDVPERLLKHPELVQRGLASRLGQCDEIMFRAGSLRQLTLKQGCVYMTEWNRDPIQVVKILDPNTEEVAIQERLLGEISRPNNHTLPSEMTVTGHPLLLMPMLHRVDMFEVWERDSLRSVLDVMFQMVEGIDFLHSLKIVHMDICWGNMLAASAHHLRWSIFATVGAELGVAREETY
ncbi:hypothetical protein C2E23DRAFT_767154 [Lenzites betulinus]|nr:hypothetical protein C2E23DRAFT_767154 [Lenzites betulinus]